MKVGIDFGTSTSEIAYVNETGKVTLIPNHVGQHITPSIVYIQEDGTPIVGQEAKERAITDPANAFLEVKRMFGQDIQLTARGKQYSPVEIANMVIYYLVGCAENFLKQTVDSAVITVPAYFTDAQRRDVMAAGKMAGLSVERIINEPTAASLDYGIRNMSDCSNILVYDLGGGTLDVTVLELFEGVVDVLSSCGNNTLGGKDFDQALAGRIVNAIKKRGKVDITQDPRAMLRIKLAAEECKIQLSSAEEYIVELPFLYTANSEPQAYTETITRQLFEKLINEKIESTQHQIKTALADAKLTSQEIDMVLLVGGSTRIPLVGAFLEKIFGKLPETVIDPDLAVVRGAAIQAGVLGGYLGENAIVLTDICPYSLSTGTLRRVSTGFFVEHQEFCDILIPRNTTLPASESQIYQTASDNQQVVHVTTYQGESDDPDENELLNTFVLSGIPKGKAGKETINIRFEYDLNGILKVTAEIVSTGKSATMTVNTEETGKSVDLSRWKDAPFARTYRTILNKADRQVKLHGDDASAIEVVSNRLKKALILGWDMDVCEDLKKQLASEIEDIE
ncbi:MAG: Hsp70 family protein [Defluviitaleaceae bacterium]|nr:Hsp70 family protein [Defluviitaleaceae bacterium]